MIKFQQLKNFVNSCRSLSLFLSVKAYSRNIFYQVKNWVGRQEYVPKRFYYHKYINKYYVKTDLLDTSKRVIKRTPIYFTQFKTLLRKEGVIATFERGLYNVYTSYSELIHYESVSRFEDKGLERDEISAIKLRKKWPQYIYDLGGNDSFYNINLSHEHEDFRIKTK